MTTAWLHEYNTERPYGALLGLTPAAFAARWRAQAEYLSNEEEESIVSEEEYLSDKERPPIRRRQGAEAYQSPHQKEPEEDSYVTILRLTIRLTRQEKTPPPLLVRLFLGDYFFIGSSVALTANPFPSTLTAVADVMMIGIGEQWNIRRCST